MQHTHEFIREQEQDYGFKRKHIQEYTTVIMRESGMDEKIKKLLIAALGVIDGRTGDVSTEDGEFATTGVDNMIALQEAFCEAFDTDGDDVIAIDILPKIVAL